MTYLLRCTRCGRVEEENALVERANAGDRLRITGPDAADQAHGALLR